MYAAHYRTAPHSHVSPRVVLPIHVCHAPARAYRAGFSRTGTGNKTQISIIFLIMNLDCKNYEQYL